MGASNGLLVSPELWGIVKMKDRIVYGVSKTQPAIAGLEQPGQN